MGRGFGRGGSLGGASGPPAPTGGTSPTRFSFAATRFKFPLTSRAISASGGNNRFLCAQFVFASPDYATNNPRFFMPAFVSPSGLTETITPNTITIEGLSIKVGGVWYTVPATNLPFTIDPTTMPGVLLDAIAGITIPANTLVIGRVAYNVPDSATSALPCGTKNTSASISTPEASQGALTTLSAKLTDGTALSNLLAHADIYMPAFMVAQGGDGRPAIIITGDSIGQGVAEASVPSLWSARNECGFIPRGLDDNSTSKRLAYGNFCIPGQRPFGTNGWDVRANWSRKLDAVKLVFDAYGAWPFDHVITEHGTNSLPAANYAAYKAGMAGYYSRLTTEWGKPIIQSEMMPKAASTNGFADLSGQGPDPTADAYPAGQRWLFNADVGTNGVADPTTYFRINGYIGDSFAPWLRTCYDTGSNRDKVSIRPFNTTVAGAYVSGSSISLTAAPTVGEILIFVQGGVVKFDALVSAVSGAGPFTVTFTSLSATAGLNPGDVAQAAWPTKDGLHTGTIGHRDAYALEVIAWKIRRGWA